MFSLVILNYLQLTKILFKFALVIVFLQWLFVFPVAGQMLYHWLYPVSKFASNQCILSLVPLDIEAKKNKEKTKTKTKTTWQL